MNTLPIDLLKAAGVTELAVANTDVAYSNSFKIEAGMSFGLELQGDITSGAISVKVELEVGGSAPGTEGASDTDFTVPRAVGGGANTDCLIDSDLNTELVRFYPFAPVVAPYGRLKFTGQGSNAASAKIVRAIIHQIPN